MSEPQPPEPAPESQDERSTRGQRIQGVLAALHAVAVGGLCAIYLTAGDRTPWTEYLTIWAPVLWLVPAILLAIPLLWKRKWRANVPLAAALTVFALALVEWRPLFRFGVPDRAPDSVRLLTWNIGGGIPGNRALLNEIAQWQPDLVFLQETPDGQKSFQSGELTGYWEGFQWLDAGDCGILSRWPIRELDSQSVGPWDDPQLVSVERPEAEPLLLVNVRLMLPSLELLPISGAARKKLSDDNRLRTAQFPALAQLIQMRVREREFAGAILGGDFNTDASARSLAPIRGTMEDVWPKVGHGWGATVTNQFPVARIDHVYTSGEIRPHAAFIGESEMSDHRPLIVDVALSE